MDDAKLQLLLDRMEIIDVENRYASGIDLRDKALYRSCFTDKIETNFDPSGNSEAIKLTADDWVDQAFMLVSTFESTQHIITNHTITIEGDKATCIAYLQAQHFNTTNSLLVGGYYTNSLVRTPEGWRICKLQLMTTWTINQ